MKMSELFKKLGATVGLVAGSYASVAWQEKSSQQYMAKVKEKYPGARFYDHYQPVPGVGGYFEKRVDEESLKEKPSCDFRCS